MGGVSRFEDLIAWQKSRALVKAIYEITNQGKFSKDFGLRDQIRRAAVPVMSNIAEGYERNSPGDFYRFLMIAKASRAEVRSQLYIALDIGYVTDDEFKTLIGSATEVGRIIGGLGKSVGK